MAEIIHRIGIKGSPQEIYKALTNIEKLSGWWTSDTKGLSLKALIETGTGKPFPNDIQITVVG